MITKFSDWMLKGEITARKERFLGETKFQGSDKSKMMKPIENPRNTLSMVRKVTNQMIQKWLKQE